MELNEIQLTPSERAEIIVDFFQFKTDENDVKLVMGDENDETVLLPLQINEKEKNSDYVKEMEQRKKPIMIHDEVRNKPVSKEITLEGMGRHVLINGKQFDKDSIDLTQKQGETEVWEIYNKPDMMGGMIHPFHIHGAQFKIISVNGKNHRKIY